MKLSTLLSQSFQRNAARIAMHYEERRWTYADLERVISALASGFAARGIQAGDRVAFLLPNSPELVFINLACCKLGAVAVPLNIRLTGHELAYNLNHSETRLCVIHASLLPVLEPFLSQLTAVETLFIAASNHSVGGIEPFETLIDESRAFTDWIDTPEETPVAILYTSGTTARPKGVTHTQRSLGYTASYYSEAVNMQESDVLLGMLSMAHIFAYALQLLPSLCVGASVVVMPGNDPKSTLGLITRHRVTHLYGLPVMFSALIETAKTTACDASSLRYCVGGGDAVSPALNDSMRRVFDTDIHQACGMTEVIPYCCNRPGYENRIGTIGKPSLGMSLRLIDRNGNLAREGEEGEIQVQSNALMAGYWHDPEATAAAMDDGWFRTGDLGRCDETGYYHFVGRSKEIIISGGSNISPLEVEEVLFRHPAVQEVAVVGKPDPVLAETVAAFIVLKPGQTLSAEDLLKFAESQLALFKLPKSVVFLDALPRSATGKVHRKTLKDGFARTD
jgi:acyl-CoA synthetase (AMP-forming)/AMP-acid ligase II